MKHNLEFKIRLLRIVWFLSTHWFHLVTLIAATWSNSFMSKVQRDSGIWTPSPWPVTDLLDQRILLCFIGCSRSSNIRQEQQGTRFSFMLLVSISFLAKFLSQKAVSSALLSQGVGVHCSDWSLVFISINSMTLRTAVSDAIRRIACSA